MELDSLKAQLGNKYKFVAKYHINEIKQIIAMQNLAYCDEVVYLLEAGCVNLEMTIFYNGQNIFLGYDVCIQSTEDNGRWQSFQSLTDKVNLKVLDIEKEMFRILNKVVIENNLSYTSYNVIKKYEIKNNYSVSNASNVIQLSEFRNNYRKNVY